MFIQPKAIYRFSVFPIKIPVVYFTELEQIILKFVWNHKRSWIAKTIWERTELEVSCSLISNYTTKAIIIKTVRDWHKNRYTDQQNKTESPEINPYIYEQLSYNKGAKHIQWRKDSLFNKRCWESWTATCKRMKLDRYLTS